MFKNIEVLRDQIKAYKGVFVDACANVKRLDEAMSKYLHETAQEVCVETCNFKQLIHFLVLKIIQI